MTQAFKIKLAAIAKDEGFYLPLWVYHHFHFGFDAIDIRVNNTTDNSLKILEKLKVVYGDRLCFSLADKDMEECRVKDLNFQAYMYTKIYQETLNEGFTHLMFLDIDEYWCSASFQATIKEFLSETSAFDVCMFQWLMEVPNHERKIDDFAFQTIICSQKSDHVKSLLNMKAVVKAIRVHNYVLKKGKYILPDLEQVDFLEEDHSRGVLPARIFEAKRASLSKYFVYHQVFRSQEEYVSGLLRGNKQNGDDSLLKSNRFGFISNSPVEFNLNWQLSEASLASYMQGYKNIAEDLEVEQKLARQSVLARKEQVLDYLKNDAFLQNIHKNKMFGLSPEIYLPKPVNYPIRAKLEDVSFDEVKNCCCITCLIISEILDYELVITQSFNKELIDARINFIEKKGKSPRIVKKYEIEVDLVNLAGVVYKRLPPFCLAAKINGELVLLARSGFRVLSEKVASKAEQLRKQLLEQQVAHQANSVVQTKQPEKSGFWHKLFKKT